MILNKSERLKWSYLWSVESVYIWLLKWKRKSWYQIHTCPKMVIVTPFENENTWVDNLLYAICSCCHIYQTSRLAHTSTIERNAIPYHSELKSSFFYQKQYFCDWPTILLLLTLIKHIHCKYCCFDPKLMSWFIIRRIMQKIMTSFKFTSIQLPPLDVVKNLPELLFKEAIL